jgi:hypothetical protein
MIELNVALHPPVAVSHSAESKGHVLAAAGELWFWR